MKFIITYLFIGLLYMILIFTKGNFIEKCKDRGLTSDVYGWIAIVIVCISGFIIWPYYIRCNIIRIYQSHKD